MSSIAYLVKLEKKIDRVIEFIDEALVRLSNVEYMLAEPSGESLSSEESYESMEEEDSDYEAGDSPVTQEFTSSDDTNESDQY